MFSYDQALVDYEGDSEEEEEEEEEIADGGVVGSVEPLKKDNDEVESPNKRAKLTWLNRSRWWSISSAFQCF